MSFTSKLKSSDVADLLATAPFQWAKTMPAIAHEYTLRRKWTDDDLFANVVIAIREHGYREKWGKTVYTYFEAHGYKYWSMGAPVADTILINRAHHPPMTYDNIADRYDALFTDDDSVAENTQLAQWLQPCLETGTTLDVGCGTGLLLDICRVSNYVGIDPSAEMLRHLMQKHPLARVHVGAFEQVAGTYDNVIALFSMSYVEHPERLYRILNPGGKYFLMFYKPRYKPYTYEKTGVIIKHFAHSPDKLQALFERVIPFGNHLIATNLDL